MTVWLNGRLIAADSARIDPADRGFTLGDGLFETIRVAAGRAPHLRRHLARLADGARLLAMPPPPGEPEIDAAVLAVLAADGIADGQLRITLTRGPAPRGVLPPAEPAPTLLITAGPALPPQPARIVLATATRRNEHSPLCRIKSLNYLDNIIARQEAAGRGADDALLLNTAGRIAESTMSNLFLLLDGELVTPPVRDGALPGIARGLLLDRAGAAERAISVEDLGRAEALLLSNSLGLRPVVALDGADCPQGATALAARLTEACR
jgi:branched-chain amino acid aminotransferase